MKIEVLIEDQLELMWHQLGLSIEEQNAQYVLLGEQIKDVIRVFLCDVQKTVTRAKSKAELLEDQCKEYANHYNIIMQGDFDTSLPYNSRIRNARKRIHILKKVTADLNYEFDEAKDKLYKCYQILEKNDIPTFLSTDPNAVKKINSIVQICQTEINQRKNKISSLLNDISLVNKDLDLGEEEVPKTVGDSTISKLEKLLCERRAKRDSNIEIAITLTSSIREIEMALNYPKLTPTKTPIVSDEAILKLREKLIRLDSERETKLPETMEISKQKLRHLMNILHIPPPSHIEFPELYQSAASMSALSILQSEISRLEQIQKETTPLLDLIAKRQLILTGNSSPKQSDLSSIHLQMVTLLEDYQAKHMEPFLWDGKPLLEEIRRFSQTDIAVEVQKDMYKFITPRFKRTGKFPPKSP